LQQQQLTIFQLLDLGYLKRLLIHLKDLKKSSQSTEKCVTALQKSFALHVQKTELGIKEITKTNERQNATLEEHSKTGLAQAEHNKLARQQLRNDVFGSKGVEPRVTKLEQPGKWRKQSWQIMLSVGVGTTALYYLIKLAKIIGLLALL